MILICKALLLLILELIIEYFFGVMLTRLALKRDTNPCLNLLIGFIAYQALFQVMALIIVFTTRVLHHLSVVWLICLLVLVPLSIWYGKGFVKNQMYICIDTIKKNKEYFILFMFVVIAFAYYTSINGEANDDACYYIGLMTTSVETDSLFRYNAYTGLEMESLYLRRAFATFEIHSAVISQLTGIHPLIIARIFRACQNVILTSMAVLMCSYLLFWKKDTDGIRKSFLTVVIFWILQFPFSNTIYTPASFLLYRTYEAKSFAANLVVFLGLYLCMKMLNERNHRYLVLIGIYLWGSMALSASATVITFIECGLLLVPTWTQRWIAKRRQEKLNAN